MSPAYDVPELPAGFWQRFHHALLSPRQKRRDSMRQSLDRRLSGRRVPHPAVSDRWYRAWQRLGDAVLAELAGVCRCCPNCVRAPCAGLSAGGLCDRYCHCGELDGFGRDDDYDRGDDDNDF